MSGGNQEAGKDTHTFACSIKYTHARKTGKKERQARNTSGVYSAKNQKKDEGKKKKKKRTAGVHVAGVRQLVEAKVQGDWARGIVREGGAEGEGGGPWERGERRQEA